jgi:hypothetical protein
MKMTGFGAGNASFGTLLAVVVFMLAALIRAHAAYFLTKQ